MAISKDEAAAALIEIERTAGVALTFRDYRSLGPVLMLWGILWAVGYASMGMLPITQWGWIWLVLDALGMAMTYAMTRTATKGRLNWQPALGTAVLTIFVLATLAIMRPQSVNAYLGFPGLVLGMIYSVAGLWGRYRFICVGATIFALTLVGYFLLPLWFTYWMAIFGGGTLVLGGFWLGRV